jgi:hypothetical protein
MVWYHCVLALSLLWCTNNDKFVNIKVTSPGVFAEVYEVNVGLYQV